MRAIFILLLSLLVWSTGAHAKAPEPVKAPKGGELRTLGTLRFELVTEGPYISVYVYDEKLQPLKAAPVTVHVRVVTGKAAPRPAILKVEQDHWEFKLEPAEQARAAVEFYVDQNGQKEKLRWAIGAKPAKAKKG